MDKKIVLFTTIGKLSDEAKLHVNDSFTSWKEYGFDVIVFGEDFHKDLCEKFGFILDTEYERSEFNIPLVRGLFQKVLTYEGYDLYCYLNSDIIFKTNPKPYLNRIEFKNFMAVGKRLDVWDYPNISKSEIHNPGGIDYFFFTPDFRDWSDMPDFSIARGRFDHWLMGAALETIHPTVDLTQVFLPIHPEPLKRPSGDAAVLYNENKYKLAYQVFKNMSLFLDDQKHGQTDMTTHYMTDEGLEIRKYRPANEFKKIFV